MSDAELDYDSRAQEHRPRKSWLVGAAIRRMTAAGFSVPEIARILGVAPEAIRSALTHALDASGMVESSQAGAGE